MANAENILVGSGGRVLVTSVMNTTLPTNIATALDNNFIDLGFISEDGISFETSVDVADISAFQSLLPVRKVVTGRAVSLSFTVREWSESAILLAFGGGEINETSGVFTYTPPAAADALYETRMVVEWSDGDKDYRLVIPRGVVTDGVSTSITRGAAADLPITYSVLATDESSDPFYLITNDPAFGE